MKKNEVAIITLQGKEEVVKIKPAIGCYLGWEGCSGKADIQMGDAWICENCYLETRKG